MYLKLIKILVVFILVFIFYQCVEPFTPSLKEGEKILVIEGVITDKPGIQSVLVSQSVDLSRKWFDGEDNCNVHVIDDAGNIIEYSANGDGKYSANFSSSMLAYGKSYMLRVITSNGDIYESGFETLNPCPKIDTIWVETEENRNIESDPISRGFQVYLNSHELNQSSFYRWEIISTWEYRAKHVPDFVVEKPISNLLKRGIERPFTGIDRDTTRRCWVTEKLGDVYTKSTEQQSEDRIKQIPLNFISFADPYMKWGYSLLVKQYSMSQEAFEYFDVIYKMSSDAGGLYDTQPYMIRGNIECVSNINKSVLGFFSASGIGEKRIFIDPPDDKVYSISCNEWPVERKSDLTDKSIYFLPVYGNYVDGELMTADKICYNCLYSGGTNKKPDFWKE